VYVASGLDEKAFPRGLGWCLGIFRGGLVSENDGGVTRKEVDGRCGV